MNVKDGYAMRHAIEKGYHLVIISGRGSDGVKNRFDKLGLKDAFLWIDDKKKKLEEVMIQNNLSPDEVLYMGDDIPDLEAM
jgi:3-deoxy-D-manno-octulosonate 8-phosphate phosphatase (KDO 8-P phosphatase)